MDMKAPMASKVSTAMGILRPKNPFTKCCEKTLIASFLLEQQPWQ